MSCEVLESGLRGLSDLGEADVPYPQVFDACVKDDSGYGLRRLSWPPTVGRYVKPLILGAAYDVWIRESAVEGKEYSEAWLLSGTVSPNEAFVRNKDDSPWSFNMYPARRVGEIVTYGNITNGELRSWDKPSTGYTGYVKVRSNVIAGFPEAQKTIIDANRLLPYPTAFHNVIRDREDPKDQVKFWSPTSGTGAAISSVVIGREYNVWSRDEPGYEFTEAWIDTNDGKWSSATVTPRYGLNIPPAIRDSLGNERLVDGGWLATPGWKKTRTVVAGGTKDVNEALEKERAAAAAAAAAEASAGSTNWLLWGGLALAGVGGALLLRRYRAKRKGLGSYRDAPTWCVKPLEGELKCFATLPEAAAYKKRYGGSMIFLRGY